MYASVQELEARLGSSVFREIYPDPAAARYDLNDAQAEINGAVAVRYALPVTGPASLALLKSWNLTLAEERACARSAGSQFPEKIRIRAELIRARLDEIRKDLFRLPDAEEQTQSAVSFLSMETPVFSRNKMKLF